MLDIYLFINTNIWFTFLKDHSIGCVDVRRQGQQQEDQLGGKSNSLVKKFGPDIVAVEEVKSGWILNTYSRARFGKLFKGPDNKYFKLCRS